MSDFFDFLQRGIFLFCYNGEFFDIVATRVGSATDEPKASDELEFSDSLLLGSFNGGVIWAGFISTIWFFSS